MRTYKQIYKDYCRWIVKKTGDKSKSYKSLVEEFGEKETDVFLYKTLLKKCYDRETGMFYFCKFIIGGLTDIGYPKPFRYNSLCRTFDKLVKNHKSLAILCARGFGKSVYLTQITNIYDMFLFKHRRIILISASQEQAIKLLDQIKLIVENNEWLVTKKEPTKWASKDIGYNGGYIMTAGIGSEILGQHPNRINVDDILRSDNKLSDSQIEDYIDMNLLPMLPNRNGQIIISGTPKTSSDIYMVIDSRIKQDPKCPWVLRKYPAILDYDKKITLCPDRFSWKQLMDVRLGMGPLKFAREYQLEFFSRDTSLFPERILKPAKEAGKETILLDKPDSRGKEWSFLGAVDCARSGSVSADYTVVTIIGYNCVNQVKEIVHIWRAKGLKLSEQSRHIAEIAKKFNDCMMLVEKNNMGQDMIDELTDEWNVGVESFTTTSRSKDELIRFLISNFEHEKIVIPRGDEWSREQTDILIDELSKFCVTTTPAGNEKYEGRGSHDDCTISLALAIKATQVLGTPFAMTNFGSGGYTKDTNPYGNLMGSNRGESDLVKLIKLGVIK